MQASRHIPVCLHEVLVALRAEQGGHFLDCTLGGGGHARAILEAHPRNTLIACDRDRRALHRAESLRDEFHPRLQLRHSPFSGLLSTLREERFDGILADLGISTDQLHDERGFSFHDEAPLDMRMDEQSIRSASDVVNDTNERELYVLLREGGVGPEAKQVARAIVTARPIKTAKVLAELVARALRGKHRGKDVHPATVVFQAIRVAVNDEFAEIDSLLSTAQKLARPAARLAIISFHSLEDQRVTGAMRAWEGETPSASWPGARAGAGSGKLLTRKAIFPSAEEQRSNPASRSARLRVFEFRGGPEERRAITN